MKRFYLNMMAFCLLFWLVYGCSVDGETGMPFPPPTPVAPELLSMRVVSETEVDFEFSVPVRVLSLSFDPSLEVASIEEGRTVKVHLEQSLEPGMRIVASIRAEDAHGNTFNENVPFEKENTFPEKEGPSQGQENPEAEGSYPEKEDPSPEVEGPSQEQKDPSPEAEAPPQGQGGPSSETERPSQEQGDPSSEAEGPSQGQEDPSPEVEAPPQGQGGPSSETGGPSQEQGDPSPETERPSQEQGDPSPEVEGPSNEQGDPSSETERPSQGQESPVPETEEPSDAPSEEVERNGAPKLLINELRTEGEASGNRVEFVEFRMLSAGNLGGLRVFIHRSGSTTPTEFEFPNLEVKEGEFAVLYLRTPGDRNADASPTAHNFWIPGPSRSLLNKTSTVYVRDQDGRVVAAVMLSEEPAPSWTRTHFAEIAEYLFEQGAWKSRDGGVATPEDAVITSRVGTAITRSISRDETVVNTNTAADWYITADRGATPGMPNNARRL